MGELAAELGRAGLLAYPLDQLMPRYRKAPRLVFEAFQQVQPLRGGQHLKGQLEQPRDRVVQRVEARHDLLATTRNHVRILSARADIVRRPEARAVDQRQTVHNSRFERPAKTTETKVTQVISVTCHAMIVRRRTAAAGSVSHGVPTESWLSVRGLGYGTSSSGT